MPYPEAIKHLPIPTQMFIKKIYSRVFKQNKNALIVVVGETGSGKSYSALSLMCGIFLYRDGKLPDDDTIINHCKFKALEFMKEMNRSDLVRGDPWIWDEAGVDASNQEYNTIKNKMISWYAQTCRNQHQIVFFTLPTLGMITSQVRKLLHYYLEAVTIDATHKVGVMKPLELQYNTRLDKIYYHRMKFSYQRNISLIEVVGCPLVHKTLLEKYETNKTSFTKNLNLEIQDSLQLIDDKKLDIKKKRDSPMQSKEELKQRMKKAWDNGLRTLKEMSEYMGIAPHALSKRGGIDIIMEIKDEITQKNLISVEQVTNKPVLATA